MTKKRLKRMRSLISEARHLQEMLDQPAKTTEYVGDAAKDYRTGKPHSITITGYGQQDYPELKERYYQKLRQIQQEIAFLEGFLDQVGRSADPGYSQAVLCKWVDAGADRGRTWICAVCDCNETA